MKRPLRFASSLSPFDSELADTSSYEDMFLDRATEVLEHRPESDSSSPKIKNEPGLEDCPIEAVTFKRVRFSTSPILTGTLEPRGNSIPGATQESPQAWLKKCREQQVELYGPLKHAEDEMGTWELDLHHDRHECYNAFLFTTMEPSSDREQESSSRVFGHGTVEIKVIYDKVSNQWQRFTLDNVRYVQAAPQENNHRVGIKGLFYGARVHLPKLTAAGDQGDGFVSLSGDSGCAVGRINQGNRKIWALRTYDIHDAAQSIETTTTSESVGGKHAEKASERMTVKRYVDVSSVDISILMRRSATAQESDVTMSTRCTRSRWC